MEYDALMNGVETVTWVKNPTNPHSSEILSNDNIK